MGRGCRGQGSDQRTAVEKRCSVLLVVERIGRVQKMKDLFSSCLQFSLFSPWLLGEIR